MSQPLRYYCTTWSWSYNVTWMRKTPLSLHIPPLHSLESLLFHNLLLFWLQVPLSEYREWRNRCACVTEGEDYGTAAQILAASEATVAQWEDYESCGSSNSYSFRIYFLFPVCSLVKAEERTDEHVKTGSQTKLLFQKGFPENNFTCWTAIPGLTCKSWLGRGPHSQHQLMSIHCRSSN